MGAEQFRDLDLDTGATLLEPSDLVLLKHREMVWSYSAAF